MRRVVRNTILWVLRETDNLELAQMIADSVGGTLYAELVDYHTSRPGHDLRYALSGAKMRKLGWQPLKNLKQRIHEVVRWTLEHDEWLGE